jgi:uncharacterized membrane protein YdfJ with MMPL/SSD domain
MMMFAIVFGLSMDYEVFLLWSRCWPWASGVSVLIDATVIRLIVVPATMFLPGRYNWWIPRWLDRALRFRDQPIGDAGPAPIS